ncbi:MAG: bifunctional diaminohydroxyphosphoribosylaminopyrimidine deaminase/5-amino-6-(5-phosphoribosylamino)uracil reductase RibD [bacterium]
MKLDYEQYMNMAIRLARRAQGMTSPNPLVGAVIIDRHGKVIGKGFHKMAGKPHAEVMALRDAGTVPPGSTMIVTLEPCNHFGRTPPCTLAIKQAGIKRVVIANRDPNPGVKGGGIEYLRASGIEVINGVCEKEAEKLNEDYFKHVKTSLPFVSVKIAMSMDGKIAAHDRTSKWITSGLSLRTAHKLRNTVDAIVVGVGTIRQDDPQLTVRHVKVRQRPLYRVVFDTNLTTPVDAQIVTNQNSIYKTIILTSRKSLDNRIKYVRQFEKKGVEIVPLKTDNNGVSTEEALKFLGKRFMHVLVEGGAGIIGSFVRSQLVDKFHIFVAPKIIGEDGLYPFKGVFLKTIDNALLLKELKIQKLGVDCYVQGYPGW